ncbi:response regulator [Chitinophaga sp. SYP-B3965]|uniref:response regulator transcription factor n=1 Tax=Chitinophaga sp. SYP-B3965 TaxID=2663120 RepID=UPI00129956BF|nr:response regulator [Chitinophaga sp. SYP-B3965]MRG48135.1 response regulator [Chitinophaga sp. SYP-B3965]
MSTILLIEDNEDIRMNTSEILALANYSVLLAENGYIGIQMAGEHKPDLIICDVMMPGLDGYGVLSLLQQDAALSSIPFIFMTAVDKIKDEDGVAEYISKPFDVAVLLLAIEEKIGKKLSA